MNRRTFLRRSAGFTGMVLTGLAINPARTWSRPSNLKITDMRACTVRDFRCMENHAMDMPWWEDLVTGPEKPLIQDGCYTVPEKPGLGVELNDEVVQKYLREPKYLYKAGYFEPTPEFDQPIDRQEAIAKKIIGGFNNHGGPWVHLDEEGNLVNRADSR